MHLIQTQNKLVTLCKQIKNNDIIAIDTEFVRKNTYYPILSLIQINFKEEYFVIDILTNNLDINPLLPILENSQIYKIIHSLQQDIEIFFQINKKTPKSIIDTQIMASFCDFSYKIGYANLVKQILNKDLSKDLQYSDWLSRPLSDKQITYAVNDIKYLLQIYNHINQKISNTKKIKWFKQEMDIVLARNYDINNSNIYKNFTLSKINNTQKIKLHSLILWRDKIAQDINKPRKFIIPDKTIKEIICSEIKNYEDLNDICCNNKYLNTKLKKQILSIILVEDKADKHDTYMQNYNDFQQKIKLQNDQNKIYHKSLEIITEESYRHGISKEIIVSNNDIKLIISGKKNFSDIFQGWRLEVVGSKLKEILK